MKRASKKIKVSVMLMLLLASTALQANNIAVANASLANQVSASNYTDIQFDLSWDNSWRSNVGPGPVNWDAAYVFVKYQINNSTTCSNPIGVWNHASLDTSALNHSVTTINGVNYTIKVAKRSAVQGSLDKGVGIFLYRTDVAAPSSINWQGVLLRWKYGLDGLCDDDEVTVKVFAIEMVNVPQESFYAGDGSATTIRGHFEDALSGSPKLISSEAALTLGGGGAGSLGNNDRTGMVASAAYRDDFTDAIAETLPAIYPKGYNSFYCMKYECSQEQYMEFLNTLTAAQQAQRTTANLLGEFHWGNNQYTPSSSGNGIVCRSPISGATPGLYACDMDDDGIYNETATDGRYRAANYISRVDALAYMDWSGLRPMTELELEKANRGNQAPIANEYSWGSTNLHAGDYISGATGFSNSGGIDELPLNPSTGINGNAAWRNTVDACCHVDRYSPIRCGAFATATTNRTNSGATFYGIMEMTGNVWEIFVSVGQDAGRAFTGEHGDGSLNATGFADEDYWPGINGNNNNTLSNAIYGGATGCTQGAGMGYKSSHVSTSQTNDMRISDRYYSVYGISGATGRYAYGGFRGVRANL